MGKCPFPGTKLAVPGNCSKYLKAGRTFATQLNGTRSSIISLGTMSHSGGGNLNVLAAALVIQAKIKQDAMIEIE